MANAVYRLRGTNSIGPALSIDVITDNGSSDSNAKTLGQSVATLLGCDVTVLKADGTWIADYTPSTQGTTVTSPSGVSVQSAI